jgi:hypothetical protein
VVVFFLELVPNIFFTACFQIILYEKKMKKPRKKKNELKP